ncbi:MULTISPECIES: beta-propeller domain-containing protein [unclassified Sporosarcina]|uniref:beta-propeller domain-containing protein n=1 Tax=unclassified Sporosarcina TaxID=2647733 RepID=UPI0013046AC7|nr:MULTISPECIES: beta-propeller domain-containing protein [unclassified Sporosarcina]
MNTGRWLIVLGVAGTIGILVLISFLFWPKVGITSTQSVLAGQSLHVYFTDPVRGNLDASQFHVTKSNKRTPAKLAYGNEKKSLQVEELQPGDYTLHIPANSFGVWKRAEDQALSFTVLESIQPVTSMKEIESFFERVKPQGRSEIMEESSSEDKASGGGNDHSQTNQQVAGVDEADTVKTDGDFLYDVLNGEGLIITDIGNPNEMVRASKIDFTDGFYANQLYVDQDKVVLIGGQSLDAPTSNMDSNMTEDRMMPTQQMSVIRVYDVTDRTNPKLIRETGAEGYVIGTRKIGQFVYMITNNQPFLWYDHPTPVEDQLVPKVYDSISNQKVQPLTLDKISILPGAIEPSYSVITTLDIESGEKGGVNTKAYLGSGEQLYMSEDHLYLTSTNYQDSQQSTSEVFKFSLDKTHVHFQQTAQLKGTILNQFSMDEHNGYFRTVTTEGNLWDERNKAKNHLFILDENMNQVGSVENLAVNERIYSARFLGDKAYMVTFRETDPLFVMDVADPNNPKVLGELKIPGFSNYLHPLDEGHLIGFGYETIAKKNPQGGAPIIQTGGMKISVFDVTDFANPKETASEVIGGQGTYSSVQHDHHALFIHPHRNLFGFPISVYEQSKRENILDLQSSGAMIYEITAERGIVKAADLTKRMTNDYMDWEKEIQRLVYSGNSLYTISVNEVNSYTLDQFTPLDTLERASYTTDSVLPRESIEK